MLTYSYAHLQIVKSLKIKDGRKERMATKTKEDLLKNKSLSKMKQKKKKLRGKKRKKGRKRKKGAERKAKKES